MSNCMCIYIFSFLFFQFQSLRQNMLWNISPKRVSRQFVKSHLTSLSNTSVWNHSNITEYVLEYLTQKGVSPIREEPLNFIVQHKCLKPLQGNSIKVMSLLLCMSHLESTAIIAHNAKHVHFEIWIASLRQKILLV